MKSLAIYRLESIKEIYSCNIPARKEAVVHFLYGLNIVQAAADRFIIAGKWKWCFHQGRIANLGRIDNFSELCIAFSTQNRVYLLSIHYFCNCPDYSVKETSGFFSTESVPTVYQKRIQPCSFLTQNLIIVQSNVIIWHFFAATSCIIITQNDPYAIFIHILTEEYLETF